MLRKNKVQFVIPVPYTPVLIKITQSIECLAHNLNTAFRSYRDVEKNKVQFVIPVPYIPVLIKITQSIECLAHNLNTVFRSYTDVEEKQSTICNSSALHLGINQDHPEYRVSSTQLKYSISFI